MTIQKYEFFYNIASKCISKSLRQEISKAATLMRVKNLITIYDEDPGYFIEEPIIDNIIITDTPPVIPVIPPITPTDPIINTDPVIPDTSTGGNDDGNGNVQTTYEATASSSVLNIGDNITINIKSPDKNGFYTYTIAVIETIGRAIMLPGKGNLDSSGSGSFNVVFSPDASFNVNKISNIDISVHIYAENSNYNNWRTKIIPFTYIPVGVTLPASYSILSKGYVYAGGKAGWYLNVTNPVNELLTGNFEYRDTNSVIKRIEVLTVSISSSSSTLTLEHDVPNDMKSGSVISFWVTDALGTIKAKITTTAPIA